MALDVSAKAVLTVAMEVFIISASLIVGVDMELLQDASIPAARNKAMTVLPVKFTFPPPMMFARKRHPNRR